MVSAFPHELFSSRTDVCISTGEALCRALLEGNEQISHLRTTLLKRKKKLEEFTAALAELGRKLNQGDSWDEMDIYGSTPSYQARYSTDDDEDSGTLQTPSRLSS